MHSQGAMSSRRLKTARYTSGRCSAMLALWRHHESPQKATSLARRAGSHAGAGRGPAGHQCTYADQLGDRPAAAALLRVGSPAAAGQAPKGHGDSAVSSKRALIMALLALLALAGYALVSTIDADMAARDEQHYCRMINDGLWPDINDGLWPDINDGLWPDINDGLWPDFKEMQNDC